MNTQITLDLLSQLKLNGMGTSLSDCAYYACSATAPLSASLWPTSQRPRYRKEPRKERKSSCFKVKLRYNAIIEQVHCSESRNLTREKLITVADCSFIERAENLLITGATGCGKSYLACAIGRQACYFGYKTLYFGINRFLERITQFQIGRHIY